jgi:hypothetical protein
MRAVAARNIVTGSTIVELIIQFLKTEKSRKKNRKRKSASN